MKKRVVVVVTGLLSMSAQAQLSSLFQGVQEQVTQAAQAQANQGVRSATDKAIESAKTQSRDAYNAVRSPSTASTSSTPVAQDATVKTE